MKNKLLISSSILIVAVFMSGAYFLGKNTTKHVNDSKVTKSTAITKNSSADDNGNQQAKNNDQSDSFEALPQKIKLALLSFKELPSDYGTGYKTHYTVYMGDQNKIVIYDDGEGAGGMAEHSVMFTDNHDGTFTVSAIQSSADSMANYNAQNSYWKKYKTLSENQMMNVYQNHKDEIEYASSLMDLSKSDQSFPLVPTNQETMPN
ncbi:glycosyltransferase [Fructobacillus pseudoficulneus]|uniref:Glycosyltransferase n=1 Tax=Fructobacillus pseudoficulneus TaxID=220714 RepID=A0A3F3H4M2_9LACO|nr:hypothetical protein [Fructobacillus pseudoficulneus]GAP02950.1 glycosyltransferase [Fructobacillus pseudoficulneus]SEH44884.1 hypothetical protein SAMN05660469_1217 [Fructobacillus pseudoficulneus]